ncbi:glycosyltransferase family 39 protein [Candidatus Chloroploca sp. M-50]|uniref:Glycosyltransferase family 39 protein n=1 Tax=Candidatus Chloroploca mongolica TaxID=2528176 RepID=A0ABS4DCH8_9CHLR|nr:glycosyltransferase family 39 protein [Candidatus Chloroploca mongolica]MBP1467142.1 glycosyltransferase family 39 protein [Candidatus Chloroploca mongolica]
MWLCVARAVLLAALAGALLIAGLSQFPVRHLVDVGGFDAAYVQGFHEAQRVTDTPDVPAYLDGSSGAARWSRASSALRFPQAGLPSTVTIRFRGPPGREVPLELWLNGGGEPVQYFAGETWQEATLPVAGGLLKATDFFVELRAPVTRLPDGREVGVLVDTAHYEVGPPPIMPYPAQVLYGAIVGALLVLVTRVCAPPTQPMGQRWWHHRSRLVAVGIIGYGLLWLFFTRLQPPFYPFPLRELPLVIIGVLGAVLVIRDGPTLVQRWPWVLTVAAPTLVIAIWTGATLLAAQQHLTLSRPGVENDFRSFATRETLEQVFRADGFYNLGYPLLLWLVRPLTFDNAFLAGRLISAASGAMLLSAGYWLARSMLASGPALVALMMLALSGTVAQYGLYIGTDMPFAACFVLCVAALIAGLQELRPPRQATLLLVLAGVAGGLAFLMRHPGLLLLPWGLLLLGTVALTNPKQTRRFRGLIVFLIAFLITISPQILINTIQTGQPLYNQQAKNVWLAVYGNIDWGRWDEAPNEIGLAELILRDPPRFFGNWANNIVGYLGSGAEDTSEFGRAIQLRLLGFPANWLALSGLLVWLALVAGALCQFLTPVWYRITGVSASPDVPQGGGKVGGLLTLIGLYVVTVSTGFLLPRFFLPLTALYAVAAGWLLGRVVGNGRLLVGAALFLSMVLWGGYGAGVRYVLDLQPADEIAAIQMVQAHVPADAMLAGNVPARLPIAKYSAIAHQVIEWPSAEAIQTGITAAELDAARAAGATYLLWDAAQGPPPLDNPEAALIAQTERYRLYRL